jgi:glycosyltransferase involved in cell wall biosynthesis
MIGDCDALHFVQSVGLEAAHKAKRRGARIICDMREEHPEFQGPLLGEDARQLNLNFSPQPASYRQRVTAELDVADFIFCPSTYARRTFIEHGISPDKLVVCPYGVDTSAFAPRADEGAAGERAPGERAPRPFTVLFLGTAGVRKGVHYLLEAFKTAQLRDARLLLAGHVDPAFRPILRQYAAWFEEVGPVPHSQLHALFARADVFVLPSLADTFGLVVLEAMAAGLPVIVSDNTGAADVVTNAREGFVVPIRNASAIAEKLTFLNEHPEQCASMGAAAKLAAQRANWDNYERICADFYQALFAPLSIAVS